MESIELKLKRHETFSIREGWIEKGLHYINKNPNCMSKDLGTKTFGLGTNMVKSLRYWLSASKLTIFKSGNAYLTNLGKSILSNDPYLENNFSLWLIHIFLVTNELDSPVFNCIFNLEYSQFTKDFLLVNVPNKLKLYNYTEITSQSSLDSDITIFLKSYYSSDFSNPEDNMGCPLTNLHLFTCDSKNIYTRKMPNYNKLDYRIVYLNILVSLNLLDGELNLTSNSISFNVEDLFTMRNNPLNILNLSKSSLFNYLEEMQKNDLIKFTKTAGLNVVYINNIKNLETIINSYYEEVK